MTEKRSVLIPAERIIRKIIILRDEKVMLDSHLAEIYGVETRALKQAVRRNADLFPPDFMFVLTGKEMQMLVSQNVIPTIKHLGGAHSYAFTESGVAMLSTVLKSARARKMNIGIMRAFVALRRFVLTNAVLRLQIHDIKKKVDDHDKNIALIFQYFDKLLIKKERPRKKIGYKLSTK
jgi:hypothetical protein